jgi:hypothetical protein
LGGKVFEGELFLSFFLARPILKKKKKTLPQTHQHVKLRRVGRQLHARVVHDHLLGLDRRVFGRDLAELGQEKAV